VAKTIGNAPAVQSPEWWLARLYKALVGPRMQRDEIAFYNDYYCGDHPLPWLAPQAQDDFRRILKMTRSNYMGLVCDATVELCRVEGFRLGAGAPKPDTDLWRIWQANNMDADSDLALLESSIGKVSYLMVAPNPADSTTPLMSVEHGSQAILERTPGQRSKTAAALKLWDDDWTGELCATLFVGGLIYKYAAKRPSSGKVSSTFRPQWYARAVAGETWPAKNPLGEPPLFELPNNPRLLTGGVSELSDVTDIQDRVNKTIADRLMDQDFGAFPQKWAKAWPDEDANGNPTPAIDIGRDRMITSAIAETDFGQFDAAPLDPYIAAKREDVKDIAARTRTPADYLLGELNNVNGETLKASRAGLVAKVRQRQRYWGEGIEAAARAVRRLASLPDVGVRELEIVWSNPEYRTEGELTDSLVKKLAAGIIDIRQAREDAGYTLTQIEALESREVEAAASAAEDPIVRAARQLTQAPTPTPTGAPDDAAGGN
jgi:hypothetical protein